MATTANNAAETTTQAPAADKPISKMEHAKKLFEEIYTPGYKFKVEGAKSHRNEFIKRAIKEFGMTQNGAATYFQNLSNKAKGEPLYKYGAKKKKEGTTKTEAGQAAENLNQTTEEANKGLIENADRTNTEGAIGKYRWMVCNEASEELSSWPIRSTATEEAKKIGAKMVDRNKLEKAE